ncbi:MAG: site-specific integrase [Myxococcota bacterium]
MRRSTKRRNARDRNLVLRGRTWYYRRIVEERLVKLSLETSDIGDARERRDAYEAAYGIGGAGFVGPHPLDIPTFREAAARTLEEDTSHLSQTTRREREVKLRSKVLAPLGDRRIDEIRSEDVLVWWNREILKKKRSKATGKLYLDAIGGVLRYHRNLGFLPEGEHAVDLFRRTQVERRGKKSSAERDPSRLKRPVKDPKALKRLLDAALARGPLPHLVALLALDAGLRLGEILGLRWGCVIWGDDAKDLRRSLVVRESRSKGLEPELPKSGLERTVDMSRRLRSALLQYRGRFTPSPEAFVLGDLDPGNFRRRTWRRVLEDADVGPVRVKDFRDTFASTLLSMGIQLGYVSEALGHGDVSVTARHYAMWIKQARYRPPATLRGGEHPADLIARVWPKWGEEPRKRGRKSTHQSTHPRTKSAKKTSGSRELVNLTDERRRRRSRARADS